MKHTFLSIGWLILILIGCTSSESVVPSPNQNPVMPIPVTTPVNEPFLLTQEALDAVVSMVALADSAITGNGFGVRTDGSDRNIKDIYTNKLLARPISVGDILVIRSYQNINSQRGQLNFIDLMVRREAGFNMGAGDFEYFRIDYDSTTDYRLHPNGLVPALSNSRDRGVDVARGGCVTCHRFAPGGDFLFTTR